MIIHDYEKGTHLLTDTAISTATNVIKKEGKKISKYKNTIVIQHMWNLKTTAMLVKIWATGTISTSFRKSEKHTCKSQHQVTTENILGNAYIYTSKGIKVKVQNIYHGQ
jgi:hypothetical protein